MFNNTVQHAPKYAIHPGIIAINVALASSSEIWIISMVLIKGTQLCFTDIFLCFNDSEREIPSQNERSILPACPPPHNLPYIE